VAVHPLVVPVTVYVVVTVGFAVTVAPVVEDNPVEGLHVYVVAPLAVSIVLPPVQIVAEDGVTTTTGTGFTVAVTCVLGPSQPAAVVQETQYKVVVLILGVTNGEPVPTCAPPVAASYHFNVPPAQPEALRLTVPVPHCEPFVPIGAEGLELIVTTNVALGPSHPVVLFTWLT
jgi:hypothetical protein